MTIIGLTVEQALLIGCLLLSIGLTAWAAATLGNPTQDKPRRPLPHPKGYRGRRTKRTALHSREDSQAGTQPLHWPPSVPPPPGRRVGLDRDQRMEQWPSDLFDD